MSLAGRVQELHICKHMCQWNRSGPTQGSTYVRLVRLVRLGQITQTLI